MVPFYLIKKFVLLFPLPTFLILLKAWSIMVSMIYYECCPLTSLCAFTGRVLRIWKWTSCREKNVPAGKPHSLTQNKSYVRFKAFFFTFKYFLLLMHVWTRSNNGTIHDKSVPCARTRLLCKWSRSWIKNRGQLFEVNIFNI